MPSEVVAQIELYRAQLGRLERSQAARMAHAWSNATAGLVAEYEGMANVMAERAARGLPTSLWHLQRLERYQTLLEQIAVKQRALEPVIVEEITTAQSAMAHLGLQHSQAILDQAAPGIIGQFDRLPYSAVANMVGNTGAGTPLGRLLRQSWASNAGAVGNALVRGTALGWHPSKTAAAMRDATDMDLTRAIVIARNETLRVYRAASMQSYRTSEMVEGWIWKADPSPRTCAACLAMDGTVHPMDEEFSSHVQCRCAPVPIVRNSPQPTFETGEEWFDRQDEPTQRGILGPGRYAVYQRGIPFERFATTRRDATWGDAVVVTPLAELVN